MLAREASHPARALLAMQLHRADLRRLLDQPVEPRDRCRRHHPGLDAEFGRAPDQRLRLLEIDEARARLHDDESHHVGPGLHGHFEV